MTSYQTFKVEFLKEGTIAKVNISRPKVLNAMSSKFFSELKTIFSSLNSHQNVRVVVLLADGKIFSSGLDLRQFASLFSFDLQKKDVARTGIQLHKVIKDLQSTFLEVFNCRVPVLVGIHNKCIGGGVDLASMCDIRYCTADTQFTIKQVDIGMAADLGTLQFLPNSIGNESTFRELAFTGRPLNSQQAQQIGFVSKVLPNREELEKQLIKTAELIAMKSPVAIYALKQVIKRQFKKKTEDSLDYQVTLNSSALITKDMEEAISAFLQKRKPVFPKL